MSDIDTSGAVAGGAGDMGAAPAAADTGASVPTGTPEGGQSPATTDANAGADKGGQPGPHDAFLDEIDGLDAPTEAKPADAATSVDAGTDGAADATGVDAAPAADPAVNADADPDNSAGDADPADTADDDPDDEAEPQEEIPEYADWRKLSPDDEKYIQRHLPKAEQKRVSLAFKHAKALRAFMNPACPPDVFIENLEKKSSMRFGEVEAAILRRNAESDPEAFLGKIFEATKDESGNSSAYKRLLDTSIQTNPEYVLHEMKRAGYDLAKSGADAGQTANSLTDEEIDGFKSSDAFSQLSEILPDEAAKLASILDSAKTAKAEAARLSAELEEVRNAKTEETEEQVKAREAAQTAAKTAVDNFSQVYQPNVVDHVKKTLDSTYGLASSAEEQSKSPMMARLKAAKRAIVMQGGIDGTGDFDNDLYAWGATRPAFKQAAEAMVKYAKAGELDNAKAAAREMQPFVDMFLAERMKHDDVKFIDEIIQMYAAKQKADLEKPHDDDTQDGNTTRRPGGGRASLEDEIDAM